MTVITVRQYKDQVWFLDGEGFHKGWIKTARVISEKNVPIKIQYFVVHYGDHDLFMGKELPPSLVFDSKDEMIKYYHNLS